MKHATNANQMAEGLDTPFYDVHLIGKFDASGNMVFKRNTKLHANKNVLHIEDVEGTTGIVKSYPLGSGIGIRFEKEANGENYFLIIQSTPHADLPNSETLTTKQGVIFCVVNNELNFIGADDIRPIAGNPCDEIRGRHSIAMQKSKIANDKAALILTIPVKSGGLVNLKYNALNNITFEYKNPDTPTP